MGTLYNQSDRRYWDVNFIDVRNEIDEIKKVASECDVTFDEALRVRELLETTRKNNLFVADGDAWDEQIGGIGKCIDNLADKIEKIAEGLHPEE